MQAAHFFIWCGITVLVVVYAVLGWRVIQLRRGSAMTSGRIDQVLGEIGKSNVNFGNKIATLELWASSWVAFQESLAKRNDSEIDKLNKRLIELETENEITPPKKNDDDPLDGPRSWSAQAMAASRGEGVDYIG